MSRIGWIVVIAIVLLIILVLGAGLLVPFGWGCCGGWGMMGGWGMGPGMMGGFGFPLIGGILMFLFWALVIGGIVWLVVWLARGGAQSASHTLMNTPSMNQTPLDILKTRYAKGEITKEQFEEMKRDLGA
jgi:putative membrane protein